LGGKNEWDRTYKKNIPRVLCEIERRSINAGRIKQGTRSSVNKEKQKEFSRMLREQENFDKKYRWRAYPAWSVKPKKRKK